MSIRIIIVNTPEECPYRNDDTTCKLQSEGNWKYHCPCNDVPIDCPLQEVVSYNQYVDTDGRGNGEWVEKGYVIKEFASNCVM